MFTQYQVRRGGVVGESAYTIEQISQMFASGALLPTDEASPLGHEHWLALQFVLATAPTQIAAPPVTAPAGTQAHLHQPPQAPTPAPGQIQTYADQTTPAQARTKPVNLAILLFALPLVGVFLLWFVNPGGRNPEVLLYAVAYPVVILSAILVAVEAKLAGMKTDRQKGTYGPVPWFFLVLLLWCIAFPIYMYKRRHYGLRNYLIAAIATAAMFTGSVGIYSYIIGSKTPPMYTI